MSQTWCAWVMPTGPSTYNLAVTGTGATLNNQAADMPLLPWQMSRVCQDSTGDYWADPPLVAGSGITITPSATAVTISTGTGAGVTKIAGGSTPLSAQTIAAGVCVTPDVTVSAPGVTSTDVVSWSYQSPIGGNWVIGAQVALFSTANTVNIHICSNDGVTLNPITVNWLVVR
jgi:hypothetical protein